MATGYLAPKLDAISVRHAQRLPTGSRNNRTLSIVLPLFDMDVNWAMLSFEAKFVNNSYPGRSGNNRLGLVLMDTSAMNQSLLA